MFIVHCWWCWGEVILWGGAEFTKYPTRGDLRVEPQPNRKSGMRSIKVNIKQKGQSHP